MLFINRYQNVLCITCGSREMLNHAADCAWYSKNKEIATAYIKAVEDAGHPFEVCTSSFWPSERQVTYISESKRRYKGVYKFESDDGSSRFAVTIVRYFTNRHNGQMGAETSMLSVKVKDGSIISVCNNKKTLFGRIDIYNVFCMLFRYVAPLSASGPLLSDAFEDWLLDKGVKASSAEQLIDVYYKGKNRILKDLRVDSVSFFAAFKASQRAKIYAVAKKNGTKAAIEQMTGAKTRPLQNVLINRLSFIPVVKNAISAGFSEQDIMSLMSRSEFFTSSVFRFVYSATLAITEFGYSRKEIMGASLENLNDIDDCTRMLSRIKSAYPGYVLPKMRISELHDYLVRDFTAMQSAIKSSVKLRQPRVKDQSVIDSQYTFWAPKTEMDIFECGTSMSICVGSYENAINKNNVDIYIVSTPTRKYFACLSVIDNKLNQAKLHRNRQIHNHPEDANIIRLWCEDNGIDHSQSHDLHGPFGNKPF